MALVKGAMICPGRGREEARQWATRKPADLGWEVVGGGMVLGKVTRSSESDGRSDVTDSLDCPDKFRVP